MRSSKHQSFVFREASPDWISSHVSQRTGEIRIGERITCSITENTRFMILGISENIGPQANGGFPGSEKAFNSFLPRFLNMQSNRFLNGHEIMLAGQISQSTEFTSFEQAREQVAELDDFVEDILSSCLDQNIVPIVIGGGHNNAYPIIKAVAHSKDQPVIVINMDPHADCRALEGRHSGNPFSSAFQSGHLKDYCIIGLHKAYNNEFILKFLDEKKCRYSFFEDFLDGTLNLNSEIDDIHRTMCEKGPFGIELDLDAIKHIPSSAFTPSGFTAEEARTYIRRMADSFNCSYLHLPEGAPQSSHEEKIVGKLLAYLVHDFCCSYPKRSK